MSVTQNSNLSVRPELQSPNIDTSINFVPKQGIKKPVFDSTSNFEGAAFTSIISTVAIDPNIKQGGVTLKPWSYSPKHGASDVIKPNVDIKQGGVQLINWQFVPNQGKVKIAMVNPKIKQGETTPKEPNDRIEQGAVDIDLPNPKINHGSVDINIPNPN